jgi:hypothetical protein
MPIAWIRKDNDENVLLYRKSNPGYIRKIEKIGEFLKRCRVAGIRHDISGKIAEYHGGVLISDLNNLTFR